MQTTAWRGVPQPTRSAARRPLDAVYASVVVASIVVMVRAGRGTWFFADEWAMAEQVRGPAGLLRPYNGHLSVVILGLYRVLLELFGFGSHTPFHLAGVLSFVAVSVTAHVAFRREAGPVAAAVVGALLLWPRGISLEPGGLNHSLAAVGAVVCAYGLNAPGRRRDVLVFGGLAFALGSAGGGVAVLAAALVHAALSRARRQRWISILVPAFAWVAWRLVAVPPEGDVIARARPGKGEIVRMATEQAFASFSTVTLGNRVGGVLVALVVLVVLVDRLRRGVAAAAGTVAWLAALWVWWLGLAWSRWFLLDETTFRYDYVSLVFILLALLPSRRPDGSTSPVGPFAGWAGSAGVGPPPVHRWTAPVALLVVAAVVVPSVHGDLEAWADQQRRFGAIARATVAEVACGEEAVAGDARLSLNLGTLTAEQLRTLLDAYGPRPAGPAAGCRETAAPHRTSPSSAEVGIRCGQRRPSDGDVRCGRRPGPDGSTG